MRLKENFFDTESMVVLESMPDGRLYSNILLKLYLRSLKNEGRLMFSDRIPYNTTILAQITRHNVGVVEKALEIFKQLELVEVLDNGAIYLLDIQEYIGRTSTEADRKRVYRNRIAQEKTLGITDKGQMSDKCLDKTPPELKLEIEIDKDIKSIVQNDCTKKVKKAEIDSFFESVWKLYPTKRGKGQVSDAKKRKLFEVGYENLKVAIQRYMDELGKEEWRKPQNGSTFFNSGYIDYLGDNYLPSTEQQIKTKNKFNQFPQRQYTKEQMSDIERALINKGLED